MLQSPASNQYACGPVILSIGFVLDGIRSYPLSRKNHVGWLIDEFMIILAKTREAVIGYIYLNPLVIRLIYLI